jgi:hypothetical protein
VRVLGEQAWFHFSQVEAKLLQPLTLSKGERATHYFQEFWVHCVELQVAHDVVTAMIQKDAARVVSFGEVVRGELPPSPTSPGGNVVTSGRIYFHDRLNS